MAARALPSSAAARGRARGHALAPRLSLLAVAASAAASAVAAAALRPADPRLLVLPPPQRVTLGAAAAAAAVVAPRVAVTGCAHPYIALAEARFNARLPRARSKRGERVGATLLSEVRVDIAGGCAAAAPTLLPRAETRYDYSLSVDAASGAAHVAASSVFGAVYALETLLQLVSPADGSVPECEVEDAPAFAMRGVLLDTGRRFVPLPFILNLLDTMVAAKLNVLHLHASDQCRFAVESKLFPNLTASLTGALAGSYSQADIGAMVAAAAARGIRVVPEFDVPSHAHGLLPIRSAGLKFCGGDDPGPDAEEVFHDAANSTLGVLNALFGEMAALFPDELFSIGADETDCTPMCTCESIAALERALIAHIEGPLGKTSAGWQEVLTETGAASAATVVSAWWYVSPQDIISLGRRAIDANHSAFYLTRPPGPFPFGWSSFWADIGAGVNASSRPMLLGGVMSAWTDLWCDPWECMPSDSPPGEGGPLFPPSMDEFFSRSLGGMLFPRALVGASAFWNFDAALDSQSPDFVAAVWALNDRLVAAGAYTCPTRCDCDLLSACNVPYLPLPKPAANMSLVTRACQLPLPPTQSFRLLPRNSSSGGPAVVVATEGSSGQLLCAAFPPGHDSNDDSTFGALVLAPCAESGGGDGFGGGSGGPVLFSPRDSESGDGHLVVLDSLNPPDEPACLDAGSGINGTVSASECGSHQGFLQLNQAWAVDDGAGVLISFAGGGCLTAV